MENFIGLMAECTKDIGLMDFSMEKASILTDLEERFQENGLKDREDENIYHQSIFIISRDLQQIISYFLFFFSIQFHNLQYFQTSPQHPDNLILLQKTKIQEKDFLRIRIIILIISILNHKILDSGIIIILLNNFRYCKYAQEAKLKKILAKQGNLHYITAQSYKNILIRWHIWDSRNPRKQRFKYQNGFISRLKLNCRIFFLKNLINLQKI
ncbi:unnamed protein product [Paramecium octaurelia]|uniref:Uncharacterized protein n=1 Tax=Paramecium octaurelia TaxID=43137 RepID=A0A8S1WEL7_PAROT|nr:unnamed protein product [Paramecium octaurelia]